MSSGEGPEADISLGLSCRPIYTKERTQGCIGTGTEYDVPPRTLKGEWSQEKKETCLWSQGLKTSEANISPNQRTWVRSQLKEKRQKK